MMTSYFSPYGLRGSGCGPCSGMGSDYDNYTLDSEMNNIAVYVASGRIAEAEKLLSDAVTYFNNQADGISNAQDRWRVKLEVSRRAREMRDYIDANRNGAQARLQASLGAEQHMQDVYAAERESNRAIQEVEARRIWVGQNCPELYESVLPLEAQEAICKAKLAGKDALGNVEWTKYALYAGAAYVALELLKAFAKGKGGR